MSYLPIALAAYFLNTVSVTVDKFLLARRIPNPLTYVFYISLFSLIVLFTLPFTLYPSPYTLILASIHTLLWTTGAYLMFSAMQKGLVTRVVPVIGALIPVILLAHALAFATVSQTQALAVVILVSGLLLLTLPDLKGSMTKKEVGLEIASAIFFAVSYLVLKEAYLRENFLTVLVYSRIPLIPLILLIFLIPILRKLVVTIEGKNLNLLSKTGLLFIGGQTAGGAHQLLLIFAISLATPALVSSLVGIQYVFLFILSLILSKKYPDIFKKDTSTKIVFLKLTGILLIAGGLYLLLS